MSSGGETIELRPVSGLPEIGAGDDLGTLILTALAESGEQLHSGDIVVIAQKAVSKAEGAVRDLTEVEAGTRALDLAIRLKKDPRLVQVILDETARIVREDRVFIVETRQGFICANAGVDQSNVPGDTMVTLLPEDSDRSAALLCRQLSEASGAPVGVIISDTFGRPWRNGVINVALGVAGVAALVDHRGSSDDFGRRLESTVVAVADELATAAGMVMGKSVRTPVVLVRGLRFDAPAGTGRDLIRSAEEDLFR